MRKIRIVFYTDMEFDRKTWQQMFCNSDIARLVKAKNVTIHFGQTNANGIHNKLEDKVGGEIVQ